MQWPLFLYAVASVLYAVASVFICSGLCFYIQWWPLFLYAVASVFLNAVASFLYAVAFVFIGSSLCFYSAVASIFYMQWPLFLYAGASEYCSRRTSCTVGIDYLPRRRPLSVHDPPPPPLSMPLWYGRDKGHRAISVLGFMEGGACFQSDQPAENRRTIKFTTTSTTI